MATVEEWKKINLLFTRWFYDSNPHEKDNAWSLLLAALKRAGLDMHAVRLTASDSDDVDGWQGRVKKLEANYNAQVASLTAQLETQKAIVESNRKKHDRERIADQSEIYTLKEKIKRLEQTRTDRRTKREVESETQTTEQSARIRELEAQLAAMIVQPRRSDDPLLPTLQAYLAGLDTQIVSVPTKQIVAAVRDGEQSDIETSRRIAPMMAHEGWVPAENLIDAHGRRCRGYTRR